MCTAFALTTVLCACGGSATVQVQKQGDTTALVSGGGGRGADAEVLGLVQTSAGGCLGIVVEGAQKAVAVIWPEGSKLADDGKSIGIPDVGSVRVGQYVGGGGGEVSSPSGDRFVDVPPECLDEDLLIDATEITKVS
jgi:hypothetical protein